MRGFTKREIVSLGALGLLVCTAWFSLLLSGCGGSGAPNLPESERYGSISIAIEWPSEDTERAIPAGTNTIEVRIFQGGEELSDKTITITYPDTSGTISEIPEGETRVLAGCYASADTSTWSLGSGDDVVTVVAETTVPATITIQPDVILLPIASAVPVGVAWDGTHFWVSAQPLESGVDDVYKLDPGGHVTASFSSPANIDGSGPHPHVIPQGLAWDGTHLWLADAADGREALYKLTTTGEEVGSWGLGAHQVTDIGWDGSYLWLSENAGDSFYKYDPASPGSAAAGPFSTANPDPTGVAWDGANLWSCSSAGGSGSPGTPAVFKHDSEANGLAVISGPIATPTESAQAMVFAAGDLWYLDVGALYKMELPSPSGTGSIDVTIR